MDNQDNNGVSIKDLPVYHWHNKEEGKEEYARFSKQFKLALKHLRYLLEPGGVQRKLGVHPGEAPAQAAARREWREDLVRYEAKVAKVEDHFASALSALESFFAFATSPRHILDVAIENPPPGVLPEQWTYQRKFEAAWEALRLEYQPSTVVDLSQLKDQIMALSDQVPGGFDHFKSEFHRLHTEILATQVPDAIKLMGSSERASRTLPFGHSSAIPSIPRTPMPPGRLHSTRSRSSLRLFAKRG